MRAFDEAKKAKERSRSWADQVEFNDESRPARFRRPTGQGEADRPPEPMQAEQPRRQPEAERSREPIPGRMNPQVDWDEMVHDTRFTSDEEPDQPIDSAGHDEVVYVGSAGGTPPRLATAIGEMKTSLKTQEALYAEAQTQSEAYQA